LYISFGAQSKFSHKTGNELRTLFGGHRNAMAARPCGLPCPVQSHTQPERQLAYARILYHMAAATKELETLFDDLDKTLTIGSIHSSRIQEHEPAFYNEYQTARAIVDSAAAMK